MTSWRESDPVQPVGKRIVFRDYQPDQVAEVAEELCALYAQVYAEPPYFEGKSDVSQFSGRLAAQLQESSFLLTAAWDNNVLSGYLYGFAIHEQSPIWKTTFLFPDPGRKPQDRLYPVAFVSELLVHARYRRHGLARTLHDQFIAARSEPEAVLLAHPDATAAQAAYRHWGWCRVGRGRPFPGTPLYETLVKDLRTH
jgi:GNAT superfamily N-acetyltransferase